MNKLGCLIIMFITCGVCDAQNFVPNPSFEVYDTCPKDPGRILFAIPWFRPTMPVINTFNDGTTDYFNACWDSLTPWSGYFDVPQNMFGFQNARTGNAYAGFYTFDYGFNYREYLEVKLDSALITGTTYYVKFYVSFADSSILATDDIGLYFSTDSVLSSTHSPLSFLPQVTNPTLNFISDRLNWILISGSFVAQGGERFITIGNFVDDANIDTLFIPGGATTIPWNRLSYYLIDDVCVSTDSSTCYSSVGINDFKNKDQLILFPNPFDDLLNITIKKNELSEIVLYDIASRKLLQQTFTNSVSLNTEQLAKDIYLYEVRNKNGVIKKGKVVKD